MPLNSWLFRGGPAREFVADIFNSSTAKTRSYLRDKLDVDEILNSQSIAWTKPVGPFILRVVASEVPRLDTAISRVL